MDCSEARLLIRRNMIAGAGPGRVPQLGFHLAHCPQCRALYAARRARETDTAPRRRYTPRMLSRPRPVASTTQRIARVAVVALCCMGLMLTWFVGLPLARAVADVFVMTSLDRGDPDLGSVGHLSSPSKSLEATTPETSPEPAPTSHPTTASVAQVISHPSATPAITMRDREPTREALRDQADRWTTIDRMTPTAIAPIARTPDATALSLASHDTLGAEPTPDAAADSMTILFLGLDARNGEGFVARSDAILVAHLDPEKNRLSMLSLPRDLWVTIPGAGEGKINSAFVIGEQVGEGAALAKQTVGETIGVDIDHVVVMDFTGFRSLVDALGGISIDVPKELYDPQFPTEDYGYKVAHFLPGVQAMDGEDALTYSRIRHPDSDFERMRRQEAVVLAIARKIRERGMVRNISEADTLTSALTPYMRTDMPPTMALNLLWAMRSVDLASTQYVAADGSMLYETNIGGAYAVYADPSVLHELGTQLIEGTPDETTEPVSP